MNRPIRWGRILLATFISTLPLALYFSAVFAPGCADWINWSIGGAVRALLGTVTSLVPFSLAELVLLLTPLWAFLLVRVLWRLRGRTAQLKRFLFRSVVVLCVVLFLFFGTLGIGYRTTPLDLRLGLSTADVTLTQLTEVSRYLTEEVNRLAMGVKFGEDGASCAPITFTDVSDSLNRSFEALADSVPFLTQFPSRPKPLFVSRPFSYTNITGVYSFFTGEANINVNYPDYTIPFTMAHEMAHQRGIAREDEANFVAFLACAASDEPYIRYSGYLNLLEYVNNGLAHTDREEFSRAWDRLSPSVQAEIRAYNAFYLRYQGTVIKDIFEAFNDTYLKGNGTPGVVSYGMVVRLACAYLQVPVDQKIENA